MEEKTGEGFVQLGHLELCWDDALPPPVDPAGLTDNNEDESSSPIKTPGDPASATSTATTANKASVYPSSAPTTATTATTATTPLISGR